MTVDEVQERLMEICLAADYSFILLILMEIRNFLCTLKKKPFLTVEPFKYNYL